MSLMDRLQLGDAPAATREQVFEAFRSAAHTVWHNADFVLPHVSLSTGPPSESALKPDSKAYAMLSMTGRAPRAIDRSILSRAGSYTLRIADRLLAQDAETIRKVMIHEAVHLGHARHTREFRELVRQHGGAVSEEALEGRGIEVERKEGARFRVIRSFADEREAERWTREEMKRVPGRYRLSLGGLRVK